ncbi:MAG: hypothetical protein A2Y38_14070 [Spirochaetes bacterium GWB1_59_5]|nr:MAG: hypothetical protein A2Y38_14070 [Spirochaetes bacterium GWB1_59_5]
MSFLLVMGLLTLGLALVLTVLLVCGALDNLKMGPEQRVARFGTKFDVGLHRQEFDQQFNRHLGFMKRLALVGLVWLAGAGMVVGAVVRDFVLPRV